MSPFAVVIVNYNTREDLRACLNSVLAAGPRQVVVADNGSSDGSREMVRETFPGVDLLELANPGYGGAANRAIATTDTPYVLLLNPDTLLAPDALLALGAYLEAHPPVGMVGPRLLNPDGSLQPSCYPYPGSLRWAFDNDDLAPLRRRSTRLRESGYRTWSHDCPRRVPCVMGAVLAIRRSAFDAVGGFDESFFMYYEEIDLCYRLNAAGWEVHFAPVTEVVHAGGTSTSQRRSAMSVAHYRSAEHFHRKHYRGLHLHLVNGVWKGLAWLRLVSARARLQRAQSEVERSVLAQEVVQRRAVLTQGAGLSGP
jgi:N-acetylglucosaminyl-diphospho-decaprenol L-rhamnosyltransferase